MIRVVLTYVLPILLPTALYVVWVAWAQRRARAGGLAAPQWQDVPWSWLFVAGGVLLAATIAAGAMRGQDGTAGVYRPAHLDEAGRLVPGRFE